MDSHASGFKGMHSAATPGVTPSLGAVDADGEINWARVDKALDYFNSFDVLELASLITSRALHKGPKDVYNEAGPVRYQLTRAKQMYRELVSSICAESLETLEGKIDSLERLVRAKRWIIQTEPELRSAEEDEETTKTPAGNTIPDADGDVKLE